MNISGYNSAYTKPQQITKPAPEEIKPTKEEELAALKKQISGIYGKNSYKESSKYLQITDDAYDRMLTDPAFKEDMLYLMRQEKMYTGNALITTRITAEGWSSDNYDAVSKEHKDMIKNLLPEYMDIEPLPEIEEDDKDSVTNDNADKVPSEDKENTEKEYSTTIKNIFEE